MSNESNTTIVTDLDTLGSALQNYVEKAGARQLPDAIREATAPEWMDKHAVNDRYGLTPRQLTYMRNKGSVEFTQHGRRILYNRQSLENWIEVGRVEARNG